MNRVAFDLGFIQIYWYSIFIFLGVFAASIVVYKEAIKEKIKPDFLINMIFYIVLFGILGARIYYVLFQFPYYLRNPLEIFKIWEGGLAIHGGLLAGVLTILYHTKKYKYDTLKILDIIVVGVILGQAIGRWGNFFNGEAYGAVVSKETLLSTGIPNFIVNGMYINGVYHQPTFLYESCWNFLGFFLLLVIRKKWKYLHIGQLTGFYLIWYSIARFIIEGMRQDSLYLGSFRVAQLVSLGLIGVGIYLFFFQKKNKRKLKHLYRKEEIG